MHKPTNADYTSLKRLLRYIQGTLHFGLPLSAGSLQLTAYSDADWASDSLDRKSITGFCIFLDKSLISWCVKKKITVAKSSTEAEYQALASATSDLIWLRRLLSDFHIQQPLPTPLYCDNTSALALALNPVFHARTKHIEIDYQFIRQHINNKAISIKHISSTDQPADILTKPLPIHRFQELRAKLNLRSSKAQFEGGC
ncbi:Retrovirus-related Pol polyprotein from transposon TNT 1-94 [Dendrobium catenatum]|uniref:Retrovirus-related Pol polyprotein from transposon TNT 1-94 n=1 Tax=Dendrobium catenatum TaxID=906689 RepID=A0A2I0VYT0_9ASPA|nr:Retrovirus-related Pol polyprotein from transposon TNT 1-94 [Dendrobium catenatum]